MAPIRQGKRNNVDHLLQKPLNSTSWFHTFVTVPVRTENVKNDHLLEESLLSAHCGHAIRSTHGLCSCDVRRIVSSRLYSLCLVMIFLLAQIYCPKKIFIVSCGRMDPQKHLLIYFNPSPSWPPFSSQSEAYLLPCTTTMHHDHVPNE